MEIVNTSLGNRLVQFNSRQVLFQPHDLLLVKLDTVF